MRANTDSVNSPAPLAELPLKLAEELLDLQEAGRIMHESWSVTKREQGFHHPLECDSAPFPASVGNGAINKKLIPHQWFTCMKCHADLIPREELPQKQKDINLNAFRDVFAVLAPKSESVIRRAMLEFAERAEKATCSFCKSGAELVGKQHRLDSNITESGNYYVGCSATAIRELAEGLKK